MKKICLTVSNERTRTTKIRYDTSLYEYVGLLWCYLLTMERTPRYKVTRPNRKNVNIDVRYILNFLFSHQRANLNAVLVSLCFVFFDYTRDYNNVDANTQIECICTIVAITRFYYFVTTDYSRMLCAVSICADDNDDGGDENDM